jgi:hypothetical protein
MELITDHRARLALEEAERVKQRGLQFEELRSEFNSATVRVQVWEKMHGLRLPADADHPILDVIAAATGVTLAEVRQEQQARLLRRAKQPTADGIAS